MKKVVFAVLCIAQLFLVNVVFASHIHAFPLWDDTGAETVTNELVFVDGDLTLTITAWTSSYNTEQEQLESWQQVTGLDVGVYRDDWGLGVISSDSDGNDLDGGQSGNYADDPDEGLLFVFSHYVELLDVFVGDLDPNDDINFSVVNLLSTVDIELGKSIIDEYGPPSREWVFEFQEDFSGTAFMLWVDGDDDDVEVLGIAVVSEPGTVLILSLGLLALGFSKRRVLK